MLAKEILDRQNIRYERCVILDQRVQIFMMLYKVACPKNDEQIDLIRIQNSGASYMTTLQPLLRWYTKHQDKHFTHIFTRSLSTLKSLQILDSDNAMINGGNSYLPWSTKFPNTNVGYIHEIGEGDIYVNTINL